MAFRYYNRREIQWTLKIVVSVIMNMNIEN